jgi:hypothetical protein
MRLIARLRRDLDRNVSLRTLFAYSTPGTLAPQIDLLGLDEGTAILPGAGHKDNGELVLSFGQRRLWALDQIEGESTTYNMPIAIRMSGELSRAALEQALVALVARHEPLRTRMISGSDGMPVGSLIEIPSAKVKKCPACKLVYKIHIPVCPSCGYVKPRHEIPEISSKLSNQQSKGDILNGMKPREFDIVSSVYSIYRKHPQAEPCIMETHETLSGTLIKSFHSLKSGLEFSVWKWLKNLTTDVPKHHWHLDKNKIQSVDFLDALSKPIAIIGHKNEKGYYQIDSYQFDKASV